MIEVEGLSKQYVVNAGPVRALHDVSFRLGSRELMGLFGPSGSGKTTLLRCIAGLESPERGVIRIEGVEVYSAAAGLNVAPWKRPIGVVFQDYALWPHLSVLDNVLFPLQHGRPNALSKGERHERAKSTLRRVRLDEVAERYPSELSGGQCQRVALARALACEPCVLLMDEPLSSLDPHLRKHTREELLELLDQTRITTIFVSHEHVDALFMASQVGIMRDGRLVQLGSAPEVLRHPVDASVVETLDLGAVVRCRSDPSSGEGCTYLLQESNQALVLPCAAHRAQGDTHLLLIRSDACCLSRHSMRAPEQQKLLGRFVRAGYTARGWCILVSIEGVTLEVWEREPPHMQHGDVVELSIDIKRVQLLPG